MQFRLRFRPAADAERKKNNRSKREPSNEGYDREDLQTPTFLEFFAGAGIVRQGLLPVWRCVWANDIDPSKERIYAANGVGLSR